MIRLFRSGCWLRSVECWPTPLLWLCIVAGYWQEMEHAVVHPGHPKHAQWVTCLVSGEYAGHARTGNCVQMQDGAVNYHAATWIDGGGWMPRQQALGCHHGAFVHSKCPPVFVVCSLYMRFIHEDNTSIKSARHYQRWAFEMYPHSITASLYSSFYSYWWSPLWDLNRMHKGFRQCLWIYWMTWATLCNGFSVRLHCSLSSLVFFIKATWWILSAYSLFSCVVNIHHCCICESSCSRLVCCPQWSKHLSFQTENWDLYYENTLVFSTT